MLTSQQPSLESFYTADRIVASLGRLCGTIRVLKIAIMGRLWLFVLIIVVLADSSEAVASSALAGSSFADTYTTFAPLYELYNEYGNYMFTGAAVTIPSGLADACGELSTRLVLLEDTLQTGSQMVEKSACLSQLRLKLSSFCDHSQKLMVKAASFRRGGIFLFSKLRQIRACLWMFPSSNPFSNGCFPSPWRSWKGKIGGGLLLSPLPGRCSIRG